MRINRSHKVLRKRRDFRWSPCVYLLPGPLTLEQLQARYREAPFPTSQPPDFPVEAAWNRRGLARLPDDLAGLIQAGWVIQKDDLFSLTERGRGEVDQLLGNARRSSEWLKGKFRSLLQPELASKVTVAAQIVLASIKLPAGLLSGSVGLLNDSADTILDLLSSLLVYLGIRFNRERLVSILLVVFMVTTGGFTLYEAVERVLTPYVPKVDWFPFAAALLSAAAGLLLWTYQRYVGIHSGLMAFIAESVDSRNHVIVALSVTAGLIAALLQFGWLDMLVGLVVALLILWSAIQLLVDVWRSSAEDRVDLSRYGFWPLDAYGRLRDAHLREWMLYLIEKRQVQTRDDLVERVRQALDLRSNPWMNLVGLDLQFASENEIEQVVDELFSRGWVIDPGPLVITPAGQEHLAQHNKHPRTPGVPKDPPY